MSSEIKMKMKIKTVSEMGDRRWVAVSWSPYTSPDLCGIPSWDWGLGACAPAQWSPYTSPDLCGDLSEKWVWVLTHPRNDLWAVLRLN